MADKALPQSIKVCKVDGCGRKHHAHGQCKNHYYKFKRLAAKGKPFSRRDPNAIELHGDVAHYLRASIICLFLAAVVLTVWILEGCQSYTVTGVCRHEATYAISVMGEQHPVRVARGYWGTTDHARAQAYLDGAWRWLCVDYPDVITCAGDTGFAPNQFYKPQIWMSMFGWGLQE